VFQLVYFRMASAPRADHAALQWASIVRLLLLLTWRVWCVKSRMDGPPSIVRLSSTSISSPGSTVPGGGVAKGDTVILEENGSNGKEITE
jgi:hypothetical protein